VGWKIGYHIFRFGIGLMVLTALVYLFLLAQSIYDRFGESWMLLIPGALLAYVLGGRFMKE
jgi:hypothetical protein